MSKEDLKSVLDAYDTTMRSIGGCTDGNCVIVRPKGMHTNGGCKCSERLSDFERRRVLTAAACLRVRVERFLDGK